MLRHFFFSIVTVFICGTSYAQSNFQNALLLNGSQQYFEIPDASYLNADSTRDMTIEFRFKENNKNAFILLNKVMAEIQHDYVSNGHGWFLGLNWQSAFQPQVPFAGRHATDDLSITQFTLGEDGSHSLKSNGSRSVDNDSLWYHISIVFTLGRKILVYINGERAGIDINYGTSLGTPGEPLCFGGLPSHIDSTLSSSLYFNGLLDELRIWNTIRSQEEIKATMNDTLGLNYYSSADSGLVSYYRFDKMENLGVDGDGLFDDIRDISVNGNHGDLKGDAVLTTSVRIPNEMSPNSFELYQNYPNPFNPSTTIHFQIPVEEHVKISIYNILGQPVRTLMNKSLQKGDHQIVWDGKNEPGITVESGIYFCQVEAGNFCQSQKMVLVK